MHEPATPLLLHLEPDQLASETMQPVPPADLSRRTRALLWALRVVAVLASAMVIYTFVASI